MSGPKVQPPGKRAILRLNRPIEAPRPANPRAKQTVIIAPAPRTPPKAPPVPNQPALTRQQREARVLAQQLAAKRLRKEANRATFAQLRRHAPALFDPRQPRPLAIGIRQEIKQALALGEQQSRRVMAWWCRKPRYRAAVAAGGPRYGLDGEPRGMITPEEQASAVAGLAGGQGGADATSGGSPP